MSANQTTRPRAWLAAVPLVLLLTGACTSVPRGSQNSYEGREGGTMTATEGNEVLARSLAIKDPLHKRVDGRLVVQFTLENRRSSDTQFAWAIDWFDQQGFAEIINISINQSLSRTVLTSLTTFFVVGVLFVANRPQHNVLEGFSFAMLIGVVIGTYSSMFVASPMRRRP